MTQPQRSDRRCALRDAARRRAPPSVRRWALGLIIGLAALAGAAAPVRACSVALLLAVDVSSSVDAAEYELQTRGLANAFRAPEVQGAIMGGGGIMVAVVYWSGYQHQEVRIGWTPLRDEPEINAFAARLQAIPRRYAEFPTAIGKLLDYLADAFPPETAVCARRVIDISGDGPNNVGPDPAPLRDLLLARGVTINGLVIDDLADAPRPSEAIAHYRTEVIGGAGAFLEIANGFSDYQRAMRRKLFRELAPQMTAL